MLIEVVLACAALADCVDETGGDPKPPDVVVATAQAPKVEWAPLANSSLCFLGVMHGFRLATVPRGRIASRRIGRSCST